MKTYRIGFINENMQDETEFDAESVYEALDLFDGFCEENEFDPGALNYIEVFDLIED